MFQAILLFLGLKPYYNLLYFYCVLSVYKNYTILLLILWEM